MQVLKFGGTSVANAKNIQNVISILRDAMTRSPQTVIVLSAFGGITDALLDAVAQAAAGDEAYAQKLEEVTARHLAAVKELIPVQDQSSILSMVKKQCNDIEDICRGVFLLKELTLHTKDSIISYGELLSTKIFAAALQSRGIDSIWKDAREMIVTNSEHGRAAVDFDATGERIQTFFNEIKNSVTIVPGFIAANKKGVTTTLGRGGSDYTASILGAALHASVVEIWTDVSGMMTADPGLVSNAKVIPAISYREAMELSHFGAKVIYPRTIQPLITPGIPLWIKNTFAPADAGTRIAIDVPENGSRIRGISSIKNVALLSLEGSGMVGIPGISRKLFEALSAEKINVILITQSSSEYSICVGVEESFASLASQVINEAFDYEIQNNKVGPVSVERSLAIVAVVGDNMKNHPGISGKMFGALGRNGVNVRAIAQGSSERNISAVVSITDVRKAINVLHEEFFETTYKQVNLYICGTGNVGSKLLNQLRYQQAYLKQQMRMQVRVVGVANSRKMLFDEKGLDLQNIHAQLDAAAPMSLPAFIDNIQQKNLRNSILVDVTADASLAASYHHLLQKSVAVVACNKIACSSSFTYYQQLKELAREYNTSMLYETNVGAGLPVIGTLSDLVRSGDKIERIEAVLSGTLNYVFNNYTGEKSFASVVKQAQEEGYTEPDPRLDLSGTDVARKILILARDSGEALEMDEIKIQSFLPAACMEGSVADFYAEMERQEPYFLSLLTGPRETGNKLKFVARYENGVASVGLQQIDPQHDFYHLYGKDNAVLFYTNRYAEQPLVIKGAGAGAEVTASGVFADIIRAAR